MKTRKLITAIAAAAAVSLMTLSASAYDINKDFKTGWSVNTTVPASEFEELDADSYITITYIADASLAEVTGQNYWVIKPMINDAGWPLVTSITGIDLAEAADSYVLPVDKTEATFQITDAEVLEHVKTAGIAFMGHGITLETLTISDEAPVTEDAADVSAADDKGNADTGVEGVAAIAGLGIVAIGAAVVSKRKSK